MDIVKTIEQLNKQIAAAEESITKHKEEIRKTRLQIRKLQTLHTKASEILTITAPAEQEKLEEV